MPISLVDPFFFSFFIILAVLIFTLSGQRKGIEHLICAVEVAI